MPDCVNGMLSLPGAHTTVWTVLCVYFNFSFRWLVFNYLSVSRHATALLSTQLNNRCVWLCACKQRCGSTCKQESYAVPANDDTLLIVTLQPFASCLSDCRLAGCHALITCKGCMQQRGIPNQYCCLQQSWWFYVHDVPACLWTTARTCCCCCCCIEHIPCHACVDWEHSTPEALLNGTCIICSTCIHAAQGLSTGVCNHIASCQNWHSSHFTSAHLKLMITDSPFCPNSDIPCSVNCSSLCLAVHPSHSIIHSWFLTVLRAHCLINICHHCYESAHLVWQHCACEIELLVCFHAWACIN